MRLALFLALALAGCASKKPAAKSPGNVENKQKELDKDKGDRDANKPDDPDDHDKTRGAGDPCEGGE